MQFEERFKRATAHPILKLVKDLVGEVESVDCIPEETLSITNEIIRAAVNNDFRRAENVVRRLAGIIAQYFEME